MPIYEYQCPKCGRVFEEWAKSSEAHKNEPCPDCGTESPRIISRTSFVLKGDGWYVSDYGYRKGITEDGGAGATPPLPSKPNTPATQGEKAVAKKTDGTLVNSNKKSDAADKKTTPASDSNSKKADSGSAKKAE